MALQLGALRDALEEAGASKDAARKAAEELAGYDRTPQGIEVKLTEMDGRIRLLQWGQGVTLAAVIAILLRVFFHG